MTNKIKSCLAALRDLWANLTPGPNFLAIRVYDPERNQADEPDQKTRERKELEACIDWVCGGGMLVFPERLHCPHCGAAWSKMDHGTTDDREAQPDPTAFE